MGRYDHARFCGYCQVWMSKDYERCPICGSLLRSVPRNPQSKLKYNGHGKYSPADAKRIFDRFLRRGYTVEEAAEATFALTGLKPEVKSDAQMVTGGRRGRR
jgi:hypothetical protein